MTHLLHSNASNISFERKEMFALFVYIAALMMQIFDRRLYYQIDVSRTLQKEFAVIQ